MKSVAIVRHPVRSATKIALVLRVQPNEFVLGGSSDG
jgi:hypothetical protein